MVSIRPATKADLPSLVALESACFPLDPWGEEALLGHLESPICATLLCLDGEQVIGALLTQHVHPEFEVLRISTHPSFRQRGVAGRLLDTLFLALRRQGYTKGLLEVRQHNTPAIALYQKKGYLPSGKRKNYYQNPTEDALLMEVAL